MSTIRTPVGPQPPAVYWRRRLLVAIFLLAVVIVVVLIVVRPGGGEPAPTPAPTGTSASSPSPSMPTAEEGDPCSPSQVTLTPVTDSNSYAANQQPLISMTIMNAGSGACTFDVGTAAQEYVIMSGSDRIWSSRDCQTGGTANVLLLEPGEPLSTTPFPWDRTRSSTTTCDSARPQVTAGGATYRLSVFLGEAESATDVPFLLN